MAKLVTDIDERLAALEHDGKGIEIRTDEAATSAVGHDWWMRALLLRRKGESQRAAAVVRPATSEQVAVVLRWAEETRTPVVPYGLGSGVCGAILPAAGHVVLDLGGMDRILGLNDENLAVTVQPGMRGSEFEEALAARGYTMGHFPQSIALSSVGGWCATRAAGQLSTKYGNIEDMLLGCEVVLAGGRRVRIGPFPRSATGPDLRELFLGSEGTLGVFTELTFRIHPAAEARTGLAFVLPSVAAGIEALRQILRQGWVPAVTRLYDATEAGRNFQTTSQGRPMLILMSEGPAALVAAEEAAVRKLVEAEGATDCGAEPVESWLEHRNHVPSFDSLLDQGLVADTIEVAIGWDALGRLFEDVTARLGEIDGMIVASGHVSHCYTQGANIYFTFVGANPDPDTAIRLYDEAWETAMRVTNTLGGTIAHHHGIGRVRRGWLPKELGAGYEVLKRVKRALDPHGILNPGVLLTDE